MTLTNDSVLVGAVIKYRVRLSAPPNMQATAHLSRPGRTGLEAYKAGHFVVTDESVEGMNLCAAYHPHEWVVDQMLRGFELVEFSPQGATMNGGQDLDCARRI